MVTLYGIPNCSQVKNARAWLEAHDIAYAFHDFKKHGINGELIEKWLSHTGWDSLVNRKGTTWRALNDVQKAGVTDSSSAMELMMASPSVVKRPVLAMNNEILVGFSEERYRQIFNK